MSGPGALLLVQLSDSHLRSDQPERETQFAAAIARVNALDPAPIAVVVTGDLADHGRADAYARAAALLGALAVPVFVLPGNHDDRPNLREAFALPGEPTDPVQSVVRAGPLRLIMCDTLVPGHVEGQLDVDWLAERLAEAPDVPTVIALHHPPAALGMPTMDGVGLPPETRTAFASLMKRSPQVLKVIAGHVHRAASTTVGGRALVTAPSVNLQLELGFTADAPAVNDDPPGFLIHALVDGELVTHVQPVPRIPS